MADAELGALVAEVKRPRSFIIIVAGLLVIAGGVALGSDNWRALVALGVPGVVIVWAGAFAVSKAVRIYERGVACGRAQLRYDALRTVHDGNLAMRGLTAGGPIGAVAAATTETDLILGDGRAFSIIKAKRTPPIDDMLQQRALPAATAAWRAKLEAGEIYKVPNTGVELTKSECWAPAPRTGQTVLLPFRDMRVHGFAAYRAGNDDPVASHAALGQDLLLRALLASYGVPVS